MNGRRAALMSMALALLAVAGAAHAQSPFGISTPDSPGGVTWAGPLAPVFVWIALRQAEFYRALTDTLDTMKGNGGAFWLLAGLSFLYGIFHAAGPGHGKAVISSYMLATGETYRRGVALSFAAAFVQALSAILFVGVAAALLRATAVQMTEATDWLEIISYALIALVGAWLLWSKARGHDHHHHHHHYVPAGDRDDHHGHDHHRHDHDDHAHHDHRHDPHSAYGRRREAHEEALDAQRDAVPLIEPRQSWRRMAAAVLAVGIRPCSGAIILLVFALAQGLFLAGIAATFVMALGTGITVAVLASIAVGARDLAARLGDAGGGRGALVARGIEILGALAVLLFGLLMLGGALAARG